MTSDETLRAVVPSLVFEPIVGQPWTDLQGSGEPRANGMPLPHVEQNAVVEPMWFCATTLDRDGRIAVVRVLQFLGWPRTTRLDVRAQPEAGEITLAAGGARAISKDGFFHLPAPVRRSCRLMAGDRLLLVALPTQERIAAFTSFAVQRLWARIEAFGRGNGAP